VNTFQFWRNKLRVHLFLLVVGLFATNLTYADCNTVMGGCAKEDAVNVSPHMKSDYVGKTKAVKPVAAPVATNKAPNKNKSDVNYASAAQKNTH
jgi:hypothetical protein